MRGATKAQSASSTKDSTTKSTRVASGLPKPTSGVGHLNQNKDSENVDLSPSQESLDTRDGGIWGLNPRDIGTRGA